MRKTRTWGGALGGLMGVSWSLALPVAAADWRGFRGTDGSGVAAAAQPPTVWSDTQNLRWKAALPGPGSSSPIVVGDRVLVTCYTGYGTAAEPGEPGALVRHLICFRRGDGKELWRASVPSGAGGGEDPYRGYLSEHGYASSTPVSDGERVYVFFGKSGVLAYDLAGKLLWKVAVGIRSSNRQWGSAASLILHKGLVIVNASEESRSLRALDSQTGKEVWKAEGDGLELAYGTPRVLPTRDGRSELVLPVPGEMWGLDPDTGKLLWFATIPLAGNVCPSVAGGDGVVYAFGGFQQRGSVAIRLGGKGDVTATHVVWSSRNTSYVPSPVLLEGTLYWIDDQGTAHAAKAADGAQWFEERLQTEPNEGRPKLYASLVAANGLLFGVSRQHGTFVLKPGRTFQQVGRNRFATDRTQFNATPAVADRQIFLRSDRFLYCVEAP